MVEIAEVSALLDRLERGELSRESASAWARERSLADDRGALSYAPPEREPQIWSALQFLEGFDLGPTPETYLMSLDDLRHWRRRIGI